MTFPAPRGSRSINVYVVTRAYILPAAKLCTLEGVKSSAGGHSPEVASDD